MQRFKPHCQWLQWRKERTCRATIRVTDAQAHLHKPDMLPVWLKNLLSVPEKRIELELRIEELLRIGIPAACMSPT